MTALYSRNVSKYTVAERELVKTIVAALTIKRVPDSDIKEELERQTGKSVNRASLWYIREQIKKESYQWYKQLREGQFEYLYEFKQRINEIIDLQQRHHKIIQDNESNPSIVQTSLAELHKLNITLSNYFDIAPYIIPNMGDDIQNNSLSITQQDKPRKDIIV